MSITGTKQTLAQVCRAQTSAQHFDRTFQRIAFDSRDVSPGSLFIALKGEKVHGHTFLNQAFDAGAGLALVEDRSILDDPAFGDRVAVVQDSLRAFWALAIWWRSQLHAQLIGITGSVGKTTVKEMIAAILAPHGAGIASLKSHNNHVGVPYTISRASPSDGWAAIEMGMNHAGEIRELTRIARPQVAVITAIAPAHIGNLGSLEAIARAKLEIVEGLERGGTLVVPGGDALLRGELQTVVQSSSPFRTVFFGEQSEVQLDDPRWQGWISAPSLAGLGTIEFSLHVRTGDASAPIEVFPIRLKIGGIHNARNAAAAILAVHTAFPSIALSSLVAALEKFEAPEMRLRTVALQNGRELLDDSYNANPSSMLALLSIVSQAQLAGKRCGVVLGDMLELGEFSEQYHREIGEALAHLRPEFIIGVGPFAQRYVEACARVNIDAIHLLSPQEGASIALAKKFDILFVKGSRGVALDRFVKAIVERIGLPVA